MLWWRHEHGAVKCPKSWLRTLGYRPKIHHFFFSHKWATRFKYLSKLCPYILMYSALHIMQWFSHSLDVFTPKIKRKFFDFYILWIKTNVAYTRLEMIARTKYCTTSTASNWFVTLYYKLLPAVRSPSKHGRWRSSLLLYSISMFKIICPCWALSFRIFGGIRRRSDYIIGFIAPAIDPNKSKKLTRLIAPVHNIRGKVWMKNNIHGFTDR